MTIPIDPRFIPAFSIEDVLLDKDTGAPLSGGLVYFEQDNQRGILKPVFQITGNSPNYTFAQLPNPVTLSSIGTFEDALGNPVIPYFYPYDADGNVELYYIRVTSSEDVPQFDREAQPYVQSQDEQDILSVISNEISNPQFVNLLFDTFSGAYTINITSAVDQVIPIAPDWDLIVSGTVGSVTLSQLTPVGTLNIITNPGTILNISSTGLTKLHLRQRIYGSPNLWGSGYLSGSFVAKTYSGSTVTLDMYYSQSNSLLVPQLLVEGQLSDTGSYDQFSGSKFIPESDSTGSYPDAYIDIYFVIPLSIEIDITSVMVAFTGLTSIENINYDQESLSRQVDHLFHYYKPQLEFKPIPSMLKGWDFPLNPAQFLLSGNITTSAAYKWDQTIAQSAVGNCAFIRNTVTGGFQVTTANNNEAFYLMQYLSGGETKEFLGTKLAVNIDAFRTQAGGDVNVKVYLYRGSSSATFPTLPDTIGPTVGTFPSTGVFTLTALNWTLINRGSFGQAEGSLSTVSTADYSQLNDMIDLNFNGWEVTDSAEIANTSTFAIVVTFECPTTGTVVTINSIGLMKGDISTRPAAQSINSVLLDCQLYYEKSYPRGSVPETTNQGGALYAEMLGNFLAASTVQVATRGFGFNFYTAKAVSTPLVTLYSPISGASANVRMYLRNNGMAVTNADVVATLWTQQLLSTTGVSYFANSAVQQLVSSGGNTFPEGYIQYHYTVDARLGVV